MIARERAQAPTSPDCQGTRTGLMPVATSSTSSPFGLVVQPDRAALGVEHLLGRGDDLAEHRREVERRRQRLGDVEDRLADRSPTAGGDE